MGNGIPLEFWKGYDSSLTSIFPIEPVSRNEDLQSFMQKVEAQIWRDVPFTVSEVTWFNARNPETTKFVVKSQNGTDTVESIKSLALEFVRAKTYQQLCDEFTANIKGLSLTTVEPKELKATDQYFHFTGAPSLTTKWDFKLNSSKLGSMAIVNDIGLSIKTLSSKLELNQGYISRNLTLAVPPSHMPYLMAHTGTLSSAYDMLKATFPGLKIIAIPELADGVINRALLIYADTTFGPAGYFLVNRAPFLERNPYSLDNVEYTVTLPSVRLAITKPEQIVLLEGI